MTRFIVSYLLLLTVTFFSYAKSPSCTTQRCIAVVDVGSTGSRLHVFTYDLDQSNSPDHISELWSNKIKPGFASIGTEQTQIDSYLTTLFSDAPVNIPVYFYATAGMRLVPQAKQKIYYQEVQNWFNKKAQWTLIEAKTITGNEEALYDWLAVNYHLGTLKSAASDFIGVLDIGGASVQIVFPLSSKIKQNENSNQIVEFDLYGKHIQLFVRSFLGLGEHEIAHQLLESPACFSEGYVLPDGNLGQGDAQMCTQELTSLIKLHHVSNKVQPVLNSSRINQWYAMGGLSYLADSQPFQFQGNQLTNEQLLNQANQLICHNQWDNLKNQFSNEYLELYCLFPSYYYALMVDGYGLAANQIINYLPANENLDWAMGVVLHHH